MESFPPPKEREEWLELINGKHRFNKYILQLMIDRIRKEVSSGTKSSSDAIDEMRAFFSKYKNAFKNDLHEVFGK